MTTVTTTRIDRSHATALATVAVRQPVTRADLDAVLGAGLPAAGRDALVTTVNDLARAHTDASALATALLQLSTAAAPAPWAQLVPPGRTTMPVTLFGQSTSTWPGNCCIPGSEGNVRLEGRVRVSDDGAAAWFVLGGQEACIQPDGTFKGDLGPGATFTGRIHGKSVTIGTTSQAEVLRHEATRTAINVRHESVKGGPGGPGYDALGDMHDSIRALAGDARAPLRLKYGRPVDVDGAGADVHRRGSGVLQGFDKAIIAQADGQPAAQAVTGPFLAAWRPQWDASGMGPLGYPLSEVRRTNRGEVQVFEGGYVFGNGTVEHRTDAATAFRQVFPEWKSPEEIAAAQAISFQRQHGEKQLQAILKPLRPTLEQRVRARQGGGFHPVSDTKVIENFVQQGGYGHLKDKLVAAGLAIVRELEQKYPPARR